MSKKLGNLSKGDTLKIGGEKVKVTDVRQSEDGSRAAATLKGKGSRYEYSDSADRPVGD